MGNNIWNYTIHINNLDENVKKCFISFNEFFKDIKKISETLENILYFLEFDKKIGWEDEN